MYVMIYMIIVIDIVVFCLLLLLLCLFFLGFLIVLVFSCSPVIDFHNCPRPVPHRDNLISQTQVMKKMQFPAIVLMLGTTSETLV